MEIQINRRIYIARHDIKNITREPQWNISLDANNLPAQTVWENWCVLNRWKMQFYPRILWCIVVELNQRGKMRAFDGNIRTRVGTVYKKITLCVCVWNIILSLRLKVRFLEQLVCSSAYDFNLIITFPNEIIQWCCGCVCVFIRRYIN